MIMLESSKGGGEGGDMLMEAETAPPPSCATELY